MRFDSIAVQGAHQAKDNRHCIPVPIYQTTAFDFDNVQYAADLFDLKTAGDIYTRISNPTTQVLEERVAALEGGVGALAVSSGQAASLIAVLNIAGAGDEIVAASTLYGGTFNLFNSTLRKLGINTIFVESEDPKEYEKVINKNNIVQNSLALAIFLEYGRKNILDEKTFAEIQQSMKKQMGALMTEEYQEDIKNTLTAMAKMKDKDFCEYIHDKIKEEKRRERGR